MAAARVEPTAPRRIDETGDAAFDTFQGIDPARKAGNRRTETLSVGMGRLIKYLGNGCRFHDIAGVHDRNPPAKFCHYAQIV